jgi:hypothetical protein
MIKIRKRFFFEKKQQKTFAPCGMLHAPVSQGQKFFAEAALADQARPGIFFKKATASF